MFLKYKEKSFPHKLYMLNILQSLHKFGIKNTMSLHEENTYFCGVICVSFVLI
jgi:hypothetical protein